MYNLIFKLSYMPHGRLDLGTDVLFLKKHVLAQHKLYKLIQIQKNIK